MNKLKKIYHVLISLLAVISIVLVILDYSSTINLDQPPYAYFDLTILIIFTVDYFVRLALAKDKLQFFKTNIFDLLAIIPFNTLFSFFRISRLFRVARLMKATRLAKVLRFTRLVGLLGKLKNHASKFLKTNGFIYLIYLSMIVLVIAAVMYSLAEKVSLADAFWWAIATATTVGYGDISPYTIIGRIAAIMLMFVGIGFIGMLTSSITSYFTEQTPDDTQDQMTEILHELTDLKQQNNELSQKIDQLTRQRTNVAKHH
ncbi:ion transporter [Lapidilactobacillus wuchangensis]|uniref:ion transporter n=1 Tax=Lapidilactobacillus wuchangensis TaxID=2486001 RepID=UPI000F775F29|nr:ion transporter [Lapidilactobacillus wuchangensis]